MNPELEEDENSNLISTKKQDIPFQIAAPILVTSVNNPGVKVNTRVIGARPMEFLIIEELKMSLSGRLFVSLKDEDDFLRCRYLHDGSVYDFISRVITLLENDLTLIQYPFKYNLSKIRHYKRIGIKLEAMVKFPLDREPVKVYMQDISEQGCRIIMTIRESIAKGYPCSVEFTLPNGKKVSGLDCKVRAITHAHTRRTSTLGLEFGDAPEEQAKIVQFCNTYHTYFSG